MRLVVQNKEDGVKTEGILTKKDGSLLALKLDTGFVRLYHWTQIATVERIYKGRPIEVNIDSLRRGRE